MTAEHRAYTFDRWLRGYVDRLCGGEMRHEKLSKITFNLGDVLIESADVFVV